MALISHTQGLTEGGGAPGALTPGATIRSAKLEILATKEMIEQVAKLSK